MVTIFDSPDYLITADQIRNIGIFRKLFYFILGIIISIVHRYFHGVFFTTLINIFLRRKVKLKYENSFYVGIEEGLKFYFPNKRVTRLLDGINKNSNYIFNSYMLDKVDFSTGDIIVDCGANVGELYLGIKNHTKNFSYIGFEPDPHVYKCLEKNINSENAKIYKEALSNKSSMEKLYLSSDGADTTLVFLDGKKSIEVNTIKLDKLNLSKVKLIKIDAEGFELEVLHGAKNTLKITEYISVDYGPEKGKERMNTIPEVTSFLYANNFKMISANSNRNVGLFKNQLIKKL